MAKISELSLPTITYILTAIEKITKHNASGHQRLAHIINQLESYQLVKRTDKEEIFYF